jgi:outer membrane protein assembly factor BamB
VNPFRIFLLPVLCACVVSVAWGQQSSNKCSDDWTEFHRANMERWNSCEKVLNVDNVGKLSLKWSYETPGRVLSSAPAVVNGIVYFPDDGNLYALNANTGSKLWSHSVGTIDSSPAVAEGVVYIGSYSSKEVSAFNASTGAKLWSYKTGGAVESSPTVVSGVVYFASDDGNLYALNGSTGAKLWSHGIGGPTESSPAVADGVVYIGSYDHNVYALDASTGAELWSYATGGQVASSPAVVNGVVYLARRTPMFTRYAPRQAPICGPTAPVA